MKNKIIILILLMATCVSAQVWGPPANWKARWLRVRTINAVPGEFTMEVNGGVPDTELTVLGFETIGSGTFYDGYQAFTGGADWDTVRGCYQTYLMYPPSTITPEMVCQNDRRMYYLQYTDYCGCADTPQSDTVYTVDGFGYWRSTGWDPENNFNFVGYYIAKLKVHRCMAQPCPVGSPGPMIPKNYTCFTDSTYIPLPDDAVPCGQSRLYFLANVFECDSVYAVLSIPEHDEVRVRLERISQYSDIFTGSYMNSVSLGLKSFNQVTLEADAYPPPAANELVKADKMNVALPIISSPPSDTLRINHDQMKLADNIVVDLKIKNDNTGGLVNARPWIFSAGYRLKTKWVANENRERDDTTYTRIFPADSSYKYCQWPYVWPSVPWKVTFSKDSVCAIGGALTIEAKGLMFYNVNMDPRYEINSDSVTAIGAAVPRYHIVIDEDPSNAEFIAELGSDRMRAIAYNEGACGYPPYIPHQQTYSPYNHYWSDATKVPCENRDGTATGIMQTVRTVWEHHFRDAGSLPPGYLRVGWDSLAWNWKIGISNADYIVNVYMDSFMQPQQLLFPDSCSLGDCDTFPKSENKEDLRAYGYNQGDGEMRKITDHTKWKEYIARTRDQTEGSQYVQDVRRYYYRKAWQ